MFELELEEAFPNLKFTFNYDTDFLPERKEMIIAARAFTEEEKREKEELQKIDSGDNFHMMDIIEELVRSKKPIVTHNGLIDMMHFYDKFIEPVPLL